MCLSVILHVHHKIRLNDSNESAHLLLKEGGHRLMSLFLIILVHSQTLYVLLLYETKQT